jgi:malate dehydrogenase (oxaloacetate-decarboxylating)
VTGQALLENPLLNKGSAFSEEERREFGLSGRCRRMSRQPKSSLREPMGATAKRTATSSATSISLAFKTENETLFYRLLQEHTPK